jgi:uncharacterized protein
VLLVVAAASLLRRGAARATDGKYEERYRPAVLLRLVVIGLGIGFVTGFFGVGGGFLIVPALATLIGLPMHLAVGTSLIAISLNALWGVIGNLGSGTLDWGLTALFGAGGAVGVLIGAGVAGRLRERALRTTFALLIVGIGVYSFFRSASTLIPLLGIN